MSTQGTVCLEALTCILEQDKGKWATTGLLARHTSPDCFQEGPWERCLGANYFYSWDCATVEKIPLQCPGWRGDPPVPSHATRGLQTSRRKIGGARRLNGAPLHARSNACILGTIIASLLAGALAEAEGKLRKRIRRRSVASNEIRGEPHARVDLSVKRGFAAGGQLQKWADGWLPGERANACSRGWSWGRVWHGQFRLSLQGDCATYRTTRPCSLPATRSEGPSILRSALQAGHAKRDVSESLRACA